MLRSSSVFHQNKGRRVGFELQEDDSWFARARTSVRKVIQLAIQTSTGSPSDGLGGGEGSESTTSTSAFIAAQQQIIAENDGEDWRVDEVIVKGDEADLLKYIGSSSGGSPLHSDHGSIHYNENPTKGGKQVRNKSEGSGSRIEMTYSTSVSSMISIFQGISKRVKHFFDQSFEDEEREEEFRKLNWYSTKPWAFYGAIYLIINWVLYLGLNHDSTKFTVYAQVLYYGGLTLLTFPLPFFIGADIPVRYPIFFQLWFAAAVWYCGITEIIQTRLCHFFIRPNICHGKDFLAMMYYITAQPALMMFVLSKRIYTLAMQIAVLVLILVFIIPVQGIFARNVVSFVIFSAFLQGLHYNRETTERRLFLLNSQLKSAYRSQQKAQLAQSKASSAKRRFASYIFHEVRVPLNNAAIAFHIMQEERVFEQENMQKYMDQIDALERSFLAMGQVLNDSLDLEKMDQGHFDINPRPFPLHNVIRASLQPLVVHAKSRGLEVHIDLDEKIDELCHIPLGQEFLTSAEDDTGDAQANGPNSNSPHPKLRTNNSKGSAHCVQPQGTSELWVRGDEVRLHQVLTNLVSNAIKFTPENTEGGIRISTKFVTSYGASNRGIWDEERVDVDDEKVGLDNGHYRHDAWEKEEEQKARRRDLGNRMERGELVVDEVEGMRNVDDEEALRHLKMRLNQNHPLGLKRRGSATGSHGQAQHTGPQDILVFRLEVIDQGPGIKPSDLADNKLFQPFGQTKVGRMSKNGTGLGLAIVRQIVSLSGGKLGIQSSKGQGATFWVELSYPIATKFEVQNAMKNTPTPEQTYTTFNHHHTSDLSAKVSHAQSLGRWPTVAFSEDAKPPMLIGMGVMGTPPLTPRSATAEMKEYGFANVLENGSARSVKDSIVSSQSRPVISQVESSGSASSRTLFEMSPKLMTTTIPEKPETGAEHENAEATVISTAASVPSASSPSSTQAATSSPPPIPVTKPPKTPKPVDPDPLFALVVDDDLVTRLQMVKLLQMNGCVVDVAKDGQECLDMLLAPDAKAYDLVSMDNHMPVKTGEEAVREIRQTGSEIFIVGCTGNALTEDQRSFVKAGVNYVLTKPINFALLRKYVQEARKRREDRRLGEGSTPGS